MKYIESNPKILGGTPVVVGTRVPVAKIIWLLSEGYSLDTIATDEYPHISYWTLQQVIKEIAKKYDK